jgi:lantibiotic modifying enzyme
MRVEMGEPITTTSEVGERPATSEVGAQNAARAELDALRASVTRCADALAGTAFLDRDRAGWLSWELTADGRPTTMRGGNPALYDGDSGSAYACALLGVALDRSDLVDLAVRAARHALRRSTGLGPGLLSGRAGVELAVQRIATLTGERVVAEEVPGAGEPAPGIWRDGGADRGSDLTDGLAGELHAAAVVGASLPVQQTLAHALAARAMPGPVGICWPEATTEKPLCGLAHGASGVALAVAEAAARQSALGEAARRLVGGALAWERAWFDPIRGSWPDLRSEPAGYPAWWCHGAAGIGLVRLRLLELQRAGVDLGLSESVLLAEAAAAIRAGSAELARAVAGADPGGPGLTRPIRPGPAGHPAGLTLCHGAGGPLELLLVAAEVLGVAEHRRLAERFTGALLAGLDEDPLQWPTGLPVAGGGGLFLGLPGAAAVLARVAFPERRLPPVGLL